MERRSLLDDEMASTRENLDVFGDEYEVEDFDGVVDGFRPEEEQEEEFDGVVDGFRPDEDDFDGVVDGFRPVDFGNGGEREEAAAMNQPVRTVSAHYGHNAISPRVPDATSRRTSMRKSMGHENPFASAEDGDGPTSTMSFEPDLHRTMSSASSVNFARTSSQRFGAGPSHPYGMYTQGTVARTSSIATQSAIPPPRRHTSVSSRAGGPQHPYTLYPQGVSEDADEEDDLQNAAPVGFPGLGQTYERRRGPDGEEQDIIGADGHTEQLPPYTRYPEEGAEKAPLLVPAAPTALHSRAPVAGTDPTMDLMHTALVPQAAPLLRQSMTDQSVLTRQTSLATIERRHTSMRPVSTMSNKSWSEKSWKEKRKTRFLGVPLWWYLLAAGVLSFVAIVIGGVIGGYVEGIAKHKVPPPPPHMESTGGITSLYDASVIATPTSGSPATGTYALKLSQPQETQAACLPNAAQQVAWSCDIAGLPAAAISVGTTPDSNQTGAFIFYGASDQSISYGTQASFMQTIFAPFMTVDDNDDSSHGPAYYFETLYDKIVVLPEAALAVPTSSKAKRSNFRLDPDWLHKRQDAALPGDKPWFCVWNNTLLEAFIYVQRPAVKSTSSSVAALSTSAANASSQAISASSKPSVTTTQLAAAGSPTEFITTTFTAASSTGTWTGPATAYSKWSAQIEHYSPRSTRSEEEEQIENDSGSDTRKRGAMDNLYDTLQQYPYVVKLEERRLAENPVVPYCQQYQILNNGAYNWVAGPDGQPIIVRLNEQDPVYSAYQSAGVAGSRKLKDKRAMVAGGCHCQWVSGD